VDMHEMVLAVAREVLRQLRGGSAEPLVLVLAQRDAALAARVLEFLGDAGELLFLGEDTGGRIPARNILPFLSCADMAVLAAGGAAGPALNETLRLLLSGAGVEVLEFEYRAYRETAPGPLYGLYASHEKTLAAFGLREFRRAEPGARRLREAVVTERAVAQAREQGASVLLVPETAKVTPLAADAAKALNINIVRRP